MDDSFICINYYDILERMQHGDHDLPSNSFDY